MERIMLIGHGSPKKDANTLESISGLLHKAMHPGCTDNCIKVAYMQFVQPDIPTAIDSCISDGATEVIIHPFFLFSGMHVTKDIPEMIEAAKTKFPSVKFIYTEPLGIHENLVKIILERINAAGFTTPLDIEKRSFELIADEEDLSDVSHQLLPIVKRVIHATADFEFKKSLVFHPEAVTKAIAAIKAGKDILTDVEMVKTGISKKLLSQFGGKVLCNLPPASDATEAKTHGSLTRAETGIWSALVEKNNIGIIAIGNAPTALLKVIELFNQENKATDLPVVIGVPVGFVKALESKALLANQPFPFITNLARKGGTPVAVAIVNALLKMASEDK
jgi:precorrin-8X/cobalt-precorrin-8 methylmutase